MVQDTMCTNCTEHIQHVQTVLNILLMEQLNHTTIMYKLVLWNIHVQSVKDAGHELDIPNARTVCTNCVVHKHTTCKAVYSFQRFTCKMYKLCSWHIHTTLVRTQLVHTVQWHLQHRLQIETITNIYFAQCCIIIKGRLPAPLPRICQAVICNGKSAL